MDLRFETWPNENGYGYTVFLDNAPWLVQPHDPEQPGFVAMTEQRATYLAQAFIDAKLAESLTEAQPES